MIKQILLAIAVLLVVSAAMAFVPAEKMRDDLKLSDEQVTKIKDIQKVSDGKRIDLRAQKEKAELEKRTALSEDTVDRAKVQKAIELSGSIDSQIELLNITQILDIRDQLTADQKKLFKEKYGDLSDMRGGSPKMKGNMDAVPRMGKGKAAAEKGTSSDKGTTEEGKPAGAGTMPKDCPMKH
jgi:Spy/CpxP family protein refolding chaperone